MKLKASDKIYQFQTFDAWGNARDGFDINNIYDEGIFWISDKFPCFVDIVKTLKRCGYLKKRYKYASQYPYESAEVIEYKGEPLGQVQETYSPEKIYHSWYTFGGFPRGIPAVVYKQTIKGFRIINPKNVILYEGETK
jgi:hypothetical protein